MEFCDLKKQYLAYKPEIDRAIQGVIDSTSFINGKEVELLEDELATFSGAKHAIACSSGTDALMLALMALDVQPGDEILCPAFSFIASASMISLLKAKPVFIDVSPLDYNIDPTKIEDKLTSRTRGIIAVSLFGQCANFKAINEIAEKNGIWVLEDGAQSFGAIYDGKRSCSLTDVATTSFFPAKPLGCYGDGGAVFTSDDKLATKIKMIRSHGQEKRYVHKRIGINGRIDTLQAAIIRVKLKHFEEEVVTRQVAALKYSELLDGHVMLPEVNNDNISVWAQYTIGVENRDKVRKKLREKSIPTAVHYPLILPAQEAFANVVPLNEKFEVAQLLSESVLSLPMHGFITNEEVEEVATAVIESI